MLDLTERLTVDAEEQIIKAQQGFLDQYRKVKEQLTERDEKIRAFEIDERKRKSERDRAQNEKEISKVTHENLISVKTDRDQGE